MRKAYTLILFCGLLAASCSKDQAPACETWEYRDECTPKRTGVVCSAVSFRSGRICDAELRAAQSGQSTVIRDTEDLTIRRFFIRKIE